jgi:hypothetical protein
MTDCLNFNDFERWIVQFDQAKTIETDKDKPLRYNVWETTMKHIKDLTKNLSVDALPDSEQSKRIADKIKNSIMRIENSTAKGGTIQKDIFDDENNIGMSIALHEIIESVKGEADKARNMGRDVSEVTSGGVLPALPMSRVAASVGRKIAYQLGYRFKRPENDGSALEIETLYYDVGKAALILLQKQGYISIDEDVPTLVDYVEKSELKSKRRYPKEEQIRSDVLSISLNEKKLGIKANTEEAAYFLKRSDANLEDTDLGVITEKLRMANLILQPNTYVLPDGKVLQGEEELAQWDSGVKAPDPKTAKARKKLYENPLKVAGPMTDLMELFNEHLNSTGESASAVLRDTFGTRKKMMSSLFGIKRSFDYSIDKKESVGGQNLSKTTPIDDLAEYWDLLKGDLHMPMKIGRNARLYYINSVLNAHGSKHSRYMLTPGKFTVDLKSDDFDMLVYNISEALGGKLTYQDILQGHILDKALKIYEEYNQAKTLTEKLHAIGRLSREFPIGTDFVNMLTGIQAIKDVRNPINGKVTTEFPIASDATASGGTLTFLQALGTNPMVKAFLQRVGVLNPDDMVQQDLDDLYGLMTEAVDDFLEGKTGIGADLGEQDASEVMRATLDMLFIKSEATRAKDIREFSKDPTMTFVYGQGRKGAIQTLSRNLADRIIDNLDDQSTLDYLAMIFDDPAYAKMGGPKLRLEEGLYPAIVERLEKTGLPSQIYDIMRDSIKNKYLREYETRSNAVWDFVKEMPTHIPFKILPAGAVLDNIPLTKENLEKYGMPLTKVTEVVHHIEGRPDTVLTRKEKPTKTVMDVSTIHGTDAAPLYHSIADLDTQEGIVVVHDEVRGSVQTVKQVNKSYVNTVKKMISTYDIHQQVMESIALQNPKIAKDPAFIKLKEEIDASVAEKKSILDKEFNDKTSALIGDGDAHVEFANTSEETKVDTAEETSTVPVEQFPKKDLGDTVVTIKSATKDIELKAQVYWNDLRRRHKVIESIKQCMATS